MGTFVARQPKRVRALRLAVRLARAVRATLAATALSFGLAAAPCIDLLATFVVETSGRVDACMVDLQENGYCFVLPGVGLDMAVRSVDAHLQEAGMPRPFWEPGPMAEATRFTGPTGDRLEIVLSAVGPFDTAGACRIVPQR